MLQIYSLYCIFNKASCACIIVLCYSGEAGGKPAVHASYVKLIKVNVAFTPYILFLCCCELPWLLWLTSPWYYHEGSFTVILRAHTSAHLCPLGHTDTDLSGVFSHIWLRDIPGLCETECNKCHTSIWPRRFGQIQSARPFKQLPVIQ